MKPPIADPVEKQRDDGAREFYPSFWAVFVRYAVMTNFLIGIPLALVLQPGDWPTHRSESGLNIVNWAFYLFPTLFALSETIKDVFFESRHREFRRFGSEEPLVATEWAGMG